MAKKNGVKIFKDYQVPERDGTYFRLLCMTGDRKGYSFIIENERIVLGRSKDADVKVMDVKSSREHAELVRYNDTFVLTDLGSQNGIVVNDLKVTQHKLKDGDLIVIGSTVYKYNVLIINNSLALVESEDGDDGDEEDNSENNNNSSKRNKNKKKNNKVLIYGVIIAVVGFLMLGDDQPIKRKKSKQSKGIGSNNSLKKLLRKTNYDDNKELKIKIESTIHKGLREFREQNYFRSLEYFNLTLNLDPQNGRAEFYLNKTQQRIDQTIKLMFIKAKREADQLKYGAAIKSYCSIIRYLQDYNQDQRYKDAEVNIEFLEQKMELGKGEAGCL